MAQITPRTLKGFRDYLPEAMAAREALIETAKRTYRSYGFSPIDTPALEHLEVLTGKGSDETDKQMYRFEDAGGRTVGMRFDLTVPLARFAAQHIQTLGTPFKRYHIATVWRGENTQAGRYREFMQCDFDTIGTKSPVADAEMVLVVNDLLRAIGIQQFTISVNNRMVLNGVLENLGLAEQSAAVLRALDKLGKIGPQKVADELLRTAGADRSQTEKLLALSSVQGDDDVVLDQIRRLVEGSEIGEQGVAQLQELLAACRASGVPAENLKLDVSIARGLDYYTGTVIETTLDQLPAIGSVASGGRYDNLAELFTKQELPGVGASLGLDRLLEALRQLNLSPCTPPSADVFVPLFDKDHTNDYLSIAAKLRRSGLRVEVYPEAKKLGKQLQYADRRGFRAAVIIGADEFAAGNCQVKDLSEGVSHTCVLSEDASELIEQLQTLIGVE
ncbi:MAG: histidine--tRNA ligase [Planctomycetota bacterium]